MRRGVVIGGLGVAIAIGALGLLGQTAALNPVPVKLTLDDAIQRGIRNNLAVLERQTADQLTRIARMRALSALLPTVTAAATQNVQENNLAVFGFRFQAFPPSLDPSAMPTCVRSPKRSFTTGLHACA